ncbi:MAG: HAD hydrolase family protein [Bacteroidota bacterium]
MKKVLQRRLTKIKLLCTDVDGVLTDGGMYYGEDGVEQKKFSTRDGMGLTLLRIAGIITSIITSEQTKIVKLRADKLKIKNLYQGVHRKMDVLDKIRKHYALEWDEIAYIGDDINDLEVLGKVGFAATPSDGCKWNKQLAHYVTERRGGDGCVREICDLILEAQHLDNKIFQLYKKG